MAKRYQRLMSGVDAEAVVGGACETTGVAPSPGDGGPGVRSSGITKPNVSDGPFDLRRVGVAPDGTAESAPESHGRFHPFSSGGRRPVAEIAVGVMWISAMAISIDHLLSHSAPLLPTLLGQVSLLGASIVFGVIGYLSLSRLSTREGRRRIATSAGAGFALGGGVSLLYALHQFLSPEAYLPFEGVLYQAFFVAVIGGIGGLVVGRQDALRAQHRENLRRERDKLSRLFNNIPDPVLEYDVRQDGEIVIETANEPFKEQFGVEPPTTMTALDDRILEDERAAEAAELADRIRAGEEIDDEVVRWTEFGRRWFWLRTVPHGQKSGFAIYTDFTERRLRDRQLQVLHRVLRHNLRNKLTIIRGHAKHLLERGGVVGERRTVEQLHESTEEILETSRGIQTVRDRLKEDPPRPERVDIVPIVSAAIDAARERHPEAEFEFRATGDPEVWGHRTIEVAIDAVLDNALEYATADSPEVTVTLTEGNESGPLLRIEVPDTEMPRQELLALEGEAEPSSLEHATGVELWIANWFVEQFGGVLDADRLDSGETAFEIKLQPVDAGSR